MGITKMELIYLINLFVTMVLLFLAILRSVREQVIRNIRWSALLNNRDAFLAGPDSRTMFWQLKKWTYNDFYGENK